MIFNLKHYVIKWIKKHDALYLVCVLSKSRFEIFALNKIEFSGIFWFNLWGGEGMRNVTKYIIISCRIFFKYNHCYKSSCLYVCFFLPCVVKEKRGKGNIFF